LGLNIVISKVIPININKLDSITGTILKSRNINSNYQILLIDQASGKRLQQSKSNSAFWAVLQIKSKLLTIEIRPQKSLQLVLINPFGVLFKRMGVMLLTSFLFSVICLLAFSFLQRILSRQKQLVAFKNEFLSTIAHELKRPVASLSYNLDCLTLPAFRQDAVKHDLLVARSIKATEELNNTINMIVALAKVEEGLLKLDKEPVNLSQLFLDLKERFMNYPVKNIEIRTAFEPEIATIQADTRLLTQCFANLIDNSIKYSGRDVLIVINIQQTGKWIVISIKDNGFGIPEEKLPVIFDKYTRLESPNTTINGFGIGLNYVKTIVEKHEGEVEVQSKQGEGTEFNILLPT
jgi:signal transduction histidine kinase